MNRDFDIIDFEPAHTCELVSMWRESFENALGIQDPHSIEEQQDYFLNEVVGNNRVLVAIKEGIIVGFIAATPESIAQLYVHVKYQGKGIGSKLLQWAKDNSTGGLWLYTFACNQRAQRFYQQKGFKEISRGFEKQWQLEDIKYSWTKQMVIVF